jgi:ATP adenylyltransferase
MKEKKDDEGCVFCTAVEEKIDDGSSLVVFRRNNIFLVLNLYPYNNGHLMVVPNRHISDLSEITTAEFAEITSQIILATEALKLLYSPHGFNVGANIGKAAGAGIDTHLHFHIVPRWNGDTNFMPIVGEAKVISHELIETKKDLIKSIKELLKQNS